MNSNNQPNQPKKSKFFRDLDARDIGHFLLTKSWIIIIAAIVCVAIALVYTHFVTPKYSAKASMMVVVGNSESQSSWAVGNQIVQATPGIINGNQFCQDVATMLTTQERSWEVNATWIDFIAIDYIKDSLGNADSYKDGIGQYTGITIADCDNDEEKAREENRKKIYNLLRDSIKVDINKDSPNTFTVTATTENPKLSYILANAVVIKYQNTIKNEFDFKNDTLVVTDIYDTGTVVEPTPENATNQNFAKNAIIAAAVAIIISALVLVVVFIFDDKIKTPDDIEKHLNLNILGTVPEFETK